MPKFERKTKEERLHEIREAAKKVFLKKGYRNATMEDIVDAAEWFEDFDWEGHLRDAIDYLELDCISRIMEPLYHTCINDFNLFDVPNADSVDHLYISFISIQQRITQ